MHKGSLKRKAILIIFSIILMFFSSGCGLVYDQIAKPEPESKKETRSFDEVVSELNTPDKVFKWMNTHIKYQADQSYTDEFREAAVTFSLGHGDCDDYAKFADHVLKAHGYESEIVNVFTNSKGHSVCAWKDAEGRYNHLSNNSYRTISAEKLEQIAEDVYTDWKAYSIYPSNQGVIRPAG